MRIVKLRDVEVGSGIPKTIVPITGRTREEIQAQGVEIVKALPHVVEWRADFYNAAPDIGSTMEMLQELRIILGNIPILFTFRTKREGGEKEISITDYKALNKAVADSGNADAVDVEVFFDDCAVLESIEHIHRAGKVVVGSNHDFHRTPSRADLIYRMRKMQDMGVDIPKIAVMPQDKSDVLTLFSATEEMSRCYADCPIITMSMSNFGVISRLCGEIFGSSMTFGTVGQASAPGQIPLEQLNTAMQIIHSAL